MPKAAVKSISPSVGLTFEEFRELVGKLKDVSNLLARELAGNSGSKKAEKLSRECHNLSIAIVGFQGGSVNSSLVELASEHRLRGLP